VFFILPRGCTLKKAEEVVLDYGVTYSKVCVQALCKWGDRFTTNFFINGELKKMFEDEFDEEIKIFPPFSIQEDRSE